MTSFLNILRLLNYITICMLSVHNAYDNNALWCLHDTSQTYETYMYLYGVYNTYDTSKIKVWDLTLAVVETETLGV